MKEPLISMVQADIIRLYKTGQQYYAGRYAFSFELDAKIWWDCREITTEQLQEIQEGCRTCWGRVTTAPSAPDAAADRTGAPGSPQAEPERAADKT